MPGSRGSQRRAGEPPVRPTLRLCPGHPGSPPARRRTAANRLFYEKRKKINYCRHLFWAEGFLARFQPRGKSAARLELGDLLTEDAARPCNGTGAAAAVIHEKSLLTRSRTAAEARGSGPANLLLGSKRSTRFYNCDVPTKGSGNKKA